MSPTSLNLGDYRFCLQQAKQMASKTRNYIRTLYTYLVAHVRHDS